MTREQARCDHRWGDWRILATVTEKVCIHCQIGALEWTGSLRPL